ncbi:hypothetical protein G3485_07790 [Shewanella baltica]|uniref:hypothetical protein n=1 Tax=Shewanella TaxID=22 RepID=UPI00217D0EF7|nr:hypothetical protein [Shewanella baltica]MCS6126635.1 hypothetical protein [Shewanella baltica]MCS6138708.1 hypothetical protein [Shewanella baltica]MCS6144897.1 hypothetical protein [Shewanella baltica]MCS6169427.1 hypothetical protein [Shewanella baltica]MCS6186651.1 hypothetical protein [Shewanella baltica]
MANIISDDDREQYLTATRGPDGDMWVGLNGFRLLRYRNMIGGGRCPHTWAALVELEAAIKRDIELQQGESCQLKAWQVASKRVIKTMKEGAK